MDCTSCGTQVEAGSTQCTECGADLQPVQAAALSSSGEKVRERGLATGCLILLRSIFTMPIRTAELAAHELRKIAKAGAIDTDRDFPHLFWCKAMLPVVATFLSAAVFLGTLGFATVTAGIGGLIAGLFVALLAAVSADWFIMIVGEYLMIKVVAARYYTQRIKEHDSDSEQH